MRIYSIAAVLICLLLGACAPKNTGSFANPALVPEKGFQLEALAEDATERLVKLYPPGQTTIFLKPSRAGHDAFATALDGKLRIRGFNMLPPDSQVAGDVLTLTYTLDQIQDDGAVYLRLMTSDGLTFSRVFEGSMAVAPPVQGTRGGQ